MKILDKRKIAQKIQRLAIEILENNYREKEVILAGINNRGFRFAEMLCAELRRISKIDFRLIHLKLNPADPLSQPVEIDIEPTDLQDKAVIVVDDVANTGRTIFYACNPLRETLPRKVEVAVLVDRTHKAFPVKVDYVGLSLATTLKENIEVDVVDGDQLEAYLN